MAARRKPAGSPLREPSMGSSHLWKTSRRASYEVCFDRKGLQMWRKRLFEEIDANPIGLGILIGLVVFVLIHLVLEWRG